MPRHVDSAQRRTEIVQALWHVLATRGFEGVSLRAVAADAGVSLGQVQHHFADKDDLVREGCRQILSLAESAYESRACGGPRDRLLALVANPIPTGPTFRVGTTVWNAYRAKSLDDEVVHGLILDAEKGRWRLAAALLAEGGVPDADLRARLLLALADGLAAQVLVDAIAADDAVALIAGEVDALAWA